MPKGPQGQKRKTVAVICIVATVLLIGLFIRYETTASPCDGAKVCYLYNVGNENAKRP